MNKSELIEKMANQGDLTKIEATAALKALITTITETLKTDEEISLIGFGTFKSVHKPERQGHNPSTGLPITISAKRTPSFKAGKTLKDAIKI